MNNVNVPAVTTLRLAGGPVRDALLEQAAAAVREMVLPPRLVAVLVGHHAASEVYVTHKLKACASVGIVGEAVRLRTDDNEAALHSLLHGLAHDAEVNAIIVQLPLPEGWDAQAALDIVPVSKDCDGLSTASVTARAEGDAQALAAATPLGVMRLLQHIGMDVRGRRAAVIGNGLLVGRPLRGLLAAAGADVIPIERDTPHPQALTRGADIIISAAGVPGLVTDSWVRPGAVVIDVGLSRPDGRELAEGQKAVLRGDVAAGVKSVAGWLTPVPGGVGPLTVASLITNIVDCARAQAGMSPFPWAIPLHAAAR